MLIYIFYEAKAQETLLFREDFRWTISPGNVLIESRFHSKEFCNMYVNAYVYWFVIEAIDYFNIET